MIACGGSVPEPETTPETTPEPTAEATRPPPQEVSASVDLDGAHIDIRIFAPAAGGAQARAAAEIAVGEVRRVGTLAGSSPELTAARGSEAPGEVSLQLLQLGYAIDRAADALTNAGMTDFMVARGDTVRARGSQDGSFERGWRVALPGATADSPPEGTVALLGRSAHTSRRADGVTTAVAPSTVTAIIWAERGVDGGPGVLQEADGQRIPLRIGTSAGDRRHNDAFDSLLDPVRVMR